MKETIAEVTAATDLLMQLADRYERGQVIAWSDIEAISGERTEFRSRHIINKWRRRLEQEREIVTLGAPNVGVRLLTHQETAQEIPRLRQRKAYKQLRRAIKQTSTVDISRLTDHQRRLLVAQQQNMADTRRELFRSQKQLQEGVKPTETNPRIKASAK
jgi:transposase-like protein